MSMSLSQNQRHDQRLTLRQRVSQAIKIEQQKLLSLGSAKLHEKIEKLVSENKFLDFDFKENSRATTNDELRNAKIAGYGPVAVRPREDLTEKHYAMLQNLPEVSSPDGRLQSYLLSQLHVNNFNAETFSCDFAEYLITHVDSFGYLTTSLDDLWRSFETDGDRIPYPKAEETLRQIQKLDPPGVGARDERERLLLLVQRFEEGHDDSLELDPPLRYLRDVHRIANEHLDVLKEHAADLQRGQFTAVSLATGMSPELLEVVLDEFKRVLLANPFANFAEATKPIIPDVTVQISETGDLTCRVNRSSCPNVIILAEFENPQRQKKLDNDARNQLADAQRLIDSLEVRQNTLQQLAEALVQCQGDFFRYGKDNLKPLTQRFVAKQIGKHESTISRANRKKWIETPHGTFPLKRCFPRGVKGSDRTRTAIKNSLSQIIETEPKEAPFSDERLCQKLLQMGISLSRRAVQKYRTELGIPPANERRTKDMKRSA